MDEGRLIDLYKFYEGVGSQARAQMVTTVNWLLTFAVGLLVYTAHNTVVVSSSWEACRNTSVLTLLAPLAGLALCAIVVATVQEFQQHVSRNWMRATRCKALVRDLYQIVAKVGDDPPNLESGWPSSLKTYESFEESPPAEGPRRRVQALFLMYTWLTGALALGFAAIFVLALLVETCVPAQPPAPAG